jgi:hypothetical protein
MIFLFQPLDGERYALGASNLVNTSFPPVRN